MSINEIAFTRTLKLYNIFKVKNTVVKSVYDIVEYHL